jgi:hypothetical protein
MTWGFAQWMALIIVALIAANSRPSLFVPNLILIALLMFILYEDGFF